MSQSTIIQNITNISADIVGNNPTKNKTIGVTLNVTAFGDRTKANQVKTKRIEENTVGQTDPAVFNFTALQPGTKYTAFVDYISGDSNVPEHVQFLNIEVKYIAFATGVNTVCVSGDGIDWVGCSQDIFTLSGNCGLWDGTKWLIGGSGVNILATSSDGKVWNLIKEGLLHSVNGISFNSAQNTYAAVGIGETTSILYSSDGVNWIKCPNNSMSFGKDVVTDGVIFVAVGDGIHYSYDGQVWNKSQTSPTDTQNKVIWNGTYWISFGDTTISRSPDGINWITVNNIYNLKYASWNGSTRWIAVGNNQTSLSTDGSSWNTPITIPNVNNIETIVYGDKLVCGIDSKSSNTTTIYYSTNNGTTWTASPQILNTRVFGIIYKRLLPYLPNGSIAPPGSCDIMNGLTAGSDGFILDTDIIPAPAGNDKSEFYLGLFDNTAGTINRTNFYQNLKYGFKLVTEGLGNNIVLRKITLVGLLDYDGITIENSYDRYNNKTEWTAIRKVDYNVALKTNQLDERILDNSVSLLERIIRDKTNDKISVEKELTPSINSSYNTAKTQFEYDSKNVYASFINIKPYQFGDPPSEYSAIADRVVNSTSGITNYVNSAISYLPKKHKKYTEVKNYLDFGFNGFGYYDKVLFICDNFVPDSNNVRLSIICKNGLVSYYFNDTLLLVIRQSYDNASIQQYKIASSSFSYATQQFSVSDSDFFFRVKTFGTSTTDSILLRKAYAHKIFFNELLSTNEKNILFYNLFIKTNSAVDLNTLKQIQSYDITQSSKLKVFSIFTLFLSTLKAKTTSSTTSLCCALYSAISNSRNEIRNDITNIINNYPSVILNIYSNIIKSFNDLTSKLTNLQTTINFLLSADYVTTLSNECVSVKNTVQTAINNIDLNNLNSVLSFIDTTRPLVNELSDLLLIYPTIGDPITPSTIDSLIRAFDDGNSGGWSTTYYLTATSPAFQIDVQSDNTNLINKTIEYLRTTSNSTSNIPGGVPIIPTITNDLKTYLTNRYSLIENFADDNFSNVSSILLSQYVEKLNGMINTYTNTVINEFLDVYTLTFRQAVYTELGQLIQYILHKSDQLQTILFDISFTIDSASITSKRVTIPAGVYTITQLISTLQTKIRQADPDYQATTVSLDNKKRVYIQTNLSNGANIVFDTIEGANVFGFLNKIAGKSIDGQNPNSEGPILMNYSKFQFFLDRLSFLIRAIDTFNNRETVLRNASNLAKTKVDNYFKFIVETRYYPFVLARINTINPNIDDLIFVNKEDSCTNGELSSKRTTYLTKKSQIQVLVSAGVNVVDLYSNVQLVIGLLSDVNVIDTYFTDARAGFEKFYSTVTLLTNTIDSYRESLQRQQRMAINYLNNPSPEILLYTGIGEDFIRSVLPTDTRFWTLQPTLNKLDYAEFRLNWTYYDRDIVSYNGQVYKCTGLAISGIPPTNTTYWKLNTSYDASKLNDTNAYQPDQRYSHYSTVTYNNQVYSCIYDFPTNGLLEYRSGTPYIAYSNSYGNTKLQESINKLAVSNFRNTSYENGIYSFTSNSRTPFMVSLFFEQLSNYTPEYITQQLTYNKGDFINGEVNTLADKVMIVTEDSDKPLYDEKVSIGGTRTDVINRFREIFGSSIYANQSGANTLLKLLQEEQITNKQLRFDTYGTPTYSITGIKAEYLYQLGYQGDTSKISLNTYPGAADSIGFSNVIESSNSNTTVRNYSPDITPYIWKRVETIKFYDNNKKYKVNDVVYELQGTVFKCFKCISVNVFTGYVINISPIGNTTYWQNIELNSELQVQLKRNKINDQYIVNDAVLVVNGSTAEKYICNQNCNGTIPVTNTNYWTKDTTYISPTNLYDSSRDYRLNDSVLFPNYLSYLFDTYICINTNVPSYNGAFDCVVQYQSAIQNVSPADSSLVWEIYNPPDTNQLTYTNQYFSEIYSDHIISLYLSRNEPVPYSSSHKYKVNNLILFPDESVCEGDRVANLKALRFIRTGAEIPTSANGFPGLQINDAIPAYDYNTYVWDGTSWKKKFRIRCYKCIRAPERFGYYTYYDGSYKTPGVPCYGIGPKTDMWRQKFFPRIMRYEYALFVDHPKLEITEKEGVLNSYFTDNSDKDFRNFRFKCNASATWTSLKNRFLSSRRDLNTPQINYTPLKNHLLKNLITELDNVYSIVVDYRNKINEIKEQFFQTDVIQQIVTNDNTKYDLVNLDKFRYIDLGYGSKETTLEYGLLSNEQIETFNSKLLENVRSYSSRTGITFEGLLGLENEKIKNNQELIKTYETNIENLMSYANDLIGFDMLEAVLNSVDDGTINYGIGGFHDGVVIPLRGIDIDYSFLSGWVRINRLNNSINDSTIFGDILTNKYKFLGTNVTILPNYKIIDLTPRAAAWTDMLTGFITGTFVGLLGISSLVSNPNNIRKNAYIKSKLLWKYRKLAHQDISAKTNINSPIQNAAILYSNNVSAYNSQIISAARDVAVQEDINDYHIRVANAAHTAMITSGVSNLLQAQTQIDTYTKTIEFEIVLTRQKRTTLAQTITKAETVNAQVLSLEAGRPIASMPPEISPPPTVDTPPTNTNINPQPTPENPNPTPANSDPPLPPPEKSQPPKDLVGKMETRKGQVEPAIRKNNVPGTYGKYAKAADGAVAFRGAGSAPTRLVGTGDPKTFIQNGSKPQNFSGSGPPEDFSTLRSRLRRVNPDPPAIPAETSSSIKTAVPEQVPEKPSIALQNELDTDIKSKIAIQEEAIPDLTTAKQEASLSATSLKAKETQLAAIPDTPENLPARTQLQTEVTTIRGEYQQKVTTVRTRVSRVSSAAAGALSLFQLGLSLASFKDMTPEQAGINAAMMIGMAVVGGVLSKLPGANVAFAAFSISSTLIEQNWVDDTLY